MIEQIELFPRASKADRAKIKFRLEKYQKYKRTIRELGVRTDLTEQEKEVLEEARGIVNDIETAINIISDEEVKEIILYRYIRAYPRKAALVRWNTFTGRTFDRKVLEGIEEIASTLKMLGKI